MSAKNTVEKIRPILEAMERSIESARRRRLNDGDEASPGAADRQVPASNGAAGSESSAFRPDESGSTDRDPKRMKARPKRTNPLI